MLSENEEFEFRLRAEREAGMSVPPPQEKNANAAPQGIPKLSAFGRPLGYQSGVDPSKTIPAAISGLKESVAGAIEHPIDSITGAVKSVGQAVMHPLDTANAMHQKFSNMNDEQRGKFVGQLAGGALTGKVAGVLGDVVGPSVKAGVQKIGIGKPVSQTVRDLANKGVVTTPGMRGGRIASGIEQRLESVPIAGDVIKRARGKSVEQWNRAALNDAISDAGGTLIPKNRTGRDAIFHTEQEMGKAYGRVLTQMKGSLQSVDPTTNMTFRQAMEQVKRAPRLNPKSAKEVAKILDEDVIAKFKMHGQVDGEAVKEIQETLRTEADDYRAGNYQQRKIAQALDLAREKLSVMLKTENPQLAQALDNVDRGYAKFKTSSKASTYSKKGLGTYTPAQKLRAIHARDRSKDKQRYASGKAKGQKETEAVESVIGNTEPDSGSAGRIATMEGALGLGGLVTGHPLVAGAAAATPLIYSQPVLKALQNRALKRGQPYTPISGKKAATVGAILGAKGERRESE